MASRWIPALIAALIALPICAEELADFSTPVFGAGGAGAVMGRGATGAYYNPANAALRPWEADILGVEFYLPTSVSASLQGFSYRLMFDTVELANDLSDRFADGAFDVNGGLDTDDIQLAFRVFERLDDLGSLRGDGMYISSATGIAARFRPRLLPRDGISISVGGFGIAAASPVVDLQSLRGYRLVDESGADWEQMVDQAIANSGQSSPTPSTSGGQNFSNELQAGGYSQSVADALAAFAEDSGISFGGGAAGVLRDFLLNTLNGDGTSLESGANPLEGNDSGFLIRGLVWYELAGSYGGALPLMGETDWLSWGATLRLIQAYAFSELFRIENMDKNGIEDTLTRLGRKISDAYRLQGDAARFNVGIDLGLTLTPPTGPLNGLAVSLSARNVNAPEFRWEPTTPGEPSLVRFDPQLTLGASYTLFHQAGMPLTIGVQGDLNRTKSYIMPRYHQQFVRVGAAFEPSFGAVGFGVRLGAFTNVGDANEAVAMTAGLGFRAYFFHLDLGGHMAFERRAFGTTDDNEPLPQRAGLSAQLSFRFAF